VAGVVRGRITTPWYIDPWAADPLHVLCLLTNDAEGSRFTKTKSASVTMTKVTIFGAG